MPKKHEQFKRKHLAMAAPGIDLGEGLAGYEISVLPNGLRVITATMPHTRSAAVQVYVGVGARDERPEVAGVSHFVEHMVFKGTRRRPNPAEISEAVEGVGGALNAATDHEHTNYRALVPSHHMDVALDVIADIVLSPVLTPEDIEKERAVILEEISSTYDSPGDIVDLVFDGMLWPDHPLGRDVAGTLESVQNMTRRDLVEHMERHYRPGATVVSVAGNVEHEQVLREVERLWNLPGGNASGPHGPAAVVSPVTPPGPQVSIYRKRTEQVNLIVGVPALSYTHPGRYAQDLLDAILGGGMSSRLFVELRENRGLAYSVSSFIKPYSDVGAFGVHAAVDNDRVGVALQAIMGELARIVDNPVPEQELRKAKEFIKGHTLLGLERSGYVAHWAGWQELVLGKIQRVDEVLGNIEAVNAEEILQLARDLFTTDKLHLAVVGPVKKSDHLEQYLKM